MKRFADGGQSGDSSVAMVDAENRALCLSAGMGARRF